MVCFEKEQDIDGREIAGKTTLLMGILGLFLFVQFIHEWSMFRRSDCSARRADVRFGSPAADHSTHSANHNTRRIRLLWTRLLGTTVDHSGEHPVRNVHERPFLPTSAGRDGFESRSRGDTPTPFVLFLTLFCLQKMPGGDQYVISDDGSTLSGGQRARLALARAIYHVSDFYWFVTRMLA